MMKILKSKSGEGYIDVVVVIMCVILVVAFSVNLFPIYIIKSQLNTFADELCREAEISGRIGTEVNEKMVMLVEETGIEPTVTWDAVYISDGKVQLNNDLAVMVTITEDIGFFNFGSFPVSLKSKANGRSEIYWK